MAYPDDFIEIDFLDVETASSGDAITIRSARNGVQKIAVVDGGYADCSQKIIDLIENFYGDVQSIQDVVLTHPDGDHAAGLKGVLEHFTVEKLWMNRPWSFVDELLPHYPTYKDRDRLISRLKKKYPHVRDLEQIANDKGVPIFDVFQGSTIGHFTVMAPSKNRFLSLVLKDDDKAEEEAETFSETFAKLRLVELAKSAINFVASAWGDENLPVKDTSPRNEMSVIQYADFGGEAFLLTGDAGREALEEAIEYAPFVGLTLPGIHHFQVPHHGSRRNVHTDLLDRLLGAKKDARLSDAQFTALICSAEMDKHHPKKAVVRAMIHRGAVVATTEGTNIRTGWNPPPRTGYVPVTGLEYPDEQED